MSDDRIVFENSDYSNPSKVTYMLHDNRFDRKIEGMEDGKSVEYTFHFSPSQK